MIIKKISNFLIFYDYIFNNFKLNIFILSIIKEKYFIIY